MPFINGRYYVNPTMGAAIESARAAAEATRSESPSSESSNDSCSADDDWEDHREAASETAPIHRIEIEASEILPSHSGRAARGFIARVHRATPVVIGRHNSLPLRPEMHAFTDHRDLLNFLLDELSNDHSRG